MIDLKDLTEKYSKATAGEWGYRPSRGDCGRVNGCVRNLHYCDEKCPECEHWEVFEGAWPTGPEAVECGDYTYFTDADAAFIALAHNAMPELLKLAGRAQAAEANYTLYNPADEGYNDGLYYRCSCGASYIDTTEAQDYEYCPHCGGKITDIENPACSGCVHPLPEDGCLWCEKSSDWVEENNINGCKHYRRGPAESEAGNEKH
jgi:hypothetical protein